MRSAAPLPGKRRRGCFGTIMKNWFIKHREVLAYLVFGVLTTLLNIVLYALFSRLFGYTAANSWGNVLDNVICILFAYVTNRAFVFASRTQGREALKEFGAFVTCRLGTLVLDAAIMMIFGNTAALLKFCQAYPKIKEINYGAVANKPGSKAFDQSVFLTPEEQADTQKLLDMGIKIYSQQTPTFKVVPIDHT